MIKLGSAIIIFTLLLSFNSCGQTERKFENGIYRIDSSIKKEVNDKLAAAWGFSLMDYKRYRNGSLSDKSGSANGANLARTIARLNGDTIRLYGGLRDYGPFGFQIDLFGDTCIVKHLDGPSDEIRKFKLTRNSEPSWNLVVGCKSYELVLAGKPSFASGEIIEGRLELLSNDYYVILNGQEERWAAQLTVYFTVEVDADYKEEE